MKPRIVCAAIRCCNDEIVLGIRYFDKIMFNTITKQGLSNFKPFEQGFIDQFGKFYNRKAAFVVAYTNNQIVRNHEGKEIKPSEYILYYDEKKESYELFSENLY